MKRRHVGCGREVEKLAGHLSKLFRIPVSFHDIFLPRGAMRSDRTVPRWMAHLKHGRLIVVIQSWDTVKACNDHKRRTWCLAHPDQFEVHAVLDDEVGDESNLGSEHVHRIREMLGVKP